MQYKQKGMQTVLQFIIGGFLLIMSGSVYLSTYQKALDSLPKVTEEAGEVTETVEAEDIPVTEETVLAEEVVVPTAVVEDVSAFPQETYYVEAPVEPVRPVEDSEVPVLAEEPSVTETVKESNE